MPCELRSDGGRQVDVHKLLPILLHIKAYSPLSIWIEKTWARPGQAPHSMYTFGEGVGALRASLVSAGLTFNYVTPQSWKKKMGVAGKDGQYTLTIAKQQIGMSAPHLTRKKDHGRADAMLIARYGQKYGDKI